MEGALAAKRRVNHRGFRCYFCQKTGHIQRNCPERVRLDSNEKKEKRRHMVNKAVRVEESDSEDDTALVLISRGAKKTTHWIVDSGATSHICNDKSMFAELGTLQGAQSVVLGDGHCLSTTASGVIRLVMLLPDGQTRVCWLHDVLWVPDLSFNLVSVPKAAKAGKKIIFDDASCTIIDHKEKVIATASKRGNIYYLNCKNAKISSQVCIAEDRRKDIWHRRYGHLGMTYLQQLARDKLVTGLEYEHVDCQASAPSVCEACIQGKLHKTKFACTQRKRATKPLELVHIDVCGRMRNKLLGGAEYFLSFIDDKTHFTWVYCLKRKSEVFQKFREWKVCVEKESGHVLKSLRTDNGGEYTSKQFRDYLLSEGIRHELTIPKTPEQNDVAERMNRTLVETVRSMLFEQSVRRSQRKRRRPDYYGAWIHSAKVVDKEPVSVEEALSGPEKQEWRKAMEREVQSMNQSDVWDLVELPNDRRAIRCRWVFKRKIGPEGEIERYKARLVAQGCSQKFGSDYDETFCPVVRFESVRMVIAVAVQYDLQLHQMDFTLAFLNGDLEEEVYMRQPKGFIDSGKEHLVCKLKHSLYGLKQSPGAGTQHSMIS